MIRTRSAALSVCIMGLAVLVGWASLASAVDGTDTISTTAGTTGGFSGDGGPATSAQLSAPHGLGLDSAANLYIADTNNGRVRKVDASGTITSVAGTTTGLAGDGGAATSAQLNQPGDVVFDGSGNLYIADTGNNRIRRVDTSGTITTVIGTTQGFGGDGAAGTAAQLSQPSGIAFDSSGNLYIADTGNNRIRKVDTSGTITSVAGTGTSGSSGDNAAATAAQLNAPRDVIVDGSGNLYIADTGNNRIRKINTAGTISNLAGTNNSGYADGSASTAQFNGPYALALDSSGNFYIADTGNNRIRKLGTNVSVTTVVGSGTNASTGDGGPATAAAISGPAGLAFKANGDLYLAEAGSAGNRVRQVNEASSGASVSPTASASSASPSASPSPSAAASSSPPVAASVFSALATPASAQAPTETKLPTTGGSPLTNFIATAGMAVLFLGMMLVYLAVPRTSTIRRKH